MKLLNKIIGSSIAFAATFAFTTQAQNLVNGSFENAGGFTANPITLTSGPGSTSGVDQGWALFGLSAQSDMSSSADSPQSGSFALLEQNAAGNNWNPAGAYQIISGVTAGQTYTYSIYFLTDTGTTYGTPVDLQLGFEDANPTDPVLGGGTTSVGFGAPNANSGAIPSNDTWYQGTVTATAPAGSVNAIVYAMFMDNGQTSTENVYFDNGSLMVAPEPSTFALAGLGGVAALVSMIRRRKA